MPWYPCVSKAEVAPTHVLCTCNTRPACGGGTRNSQLTAPKALKRNVLHHQGAPPLCCRRLPHLIPKGPHVGAGGARIRAISDRISWNICRDTATSAIWHVTWRPC